MGVSTLTPGVTVLLEVELGIPNELQKLVFASRVLSERGKTLGDYGVGEGDLVNVTKAVHAPPTSSAAPPRAPAPPTLAGHRRRSHHQRGPTIDPELYPSLSLEGGIGWGRGVCLL